VSAATVTFLSDYGLEDEFVGVCHGVIARICPQARIIDVTHGIARHDVRSGALRLRAALPYLPEAVHLAVVDPDVGAKRRAVALRTVEGRLLVGPDNGLLWLAAEASGGAVEVVEISRSPLRLEPVAATFHGRDIFAPVAAHLAAGVELAETGDPCDPAALVALELPQAVLVAGSLEVRVLDVDHFGNAILGASHDDLSGAGLKLGHTIVLELESGGTLQARYVRTFADAPHGELIVYEDATRTLAIAVRHGNAAASLGLARDARVRMRPT
jgi:S-adenosyl-L-methionine hydrolase (adenosine-forming)